MQACNYKLNAASSAALMSKRHEVAATVQPATGRIRISAACTPHVAARLSAPGSAHGHVQLLLS